MNKFMYFYQLKHGPEVDWVSLIGAQCDLYLPIIPHLLNILREKFSNLSDRHKTLKVNSYFFMPIILFNSPCTSKGLKNLN